MVKEYRHIPVMLNEVIEFFAPASGENFADCTLGGGGYTVEIAKRILPDGKILSIDLDDLAISNLKIKISDLNLQNIIAAKGNFKNLDEIVKDNFSETVRFSGIVFDLGLSSAQLEDRERGFSFNLRDAPLGMNFGQPSEFRAEEIINNWRSEDLWKIFKEYGEERFARKIAQAITRERQIKKIVTVGQLADIIVKTIPKRFQAKKIHPATKVFQTLRIAVNDELENLKLALPQTLDLLKTGGKIAVISYHSLEDRIVKRYFKKEAAGCICPPELPICRCGHKARLKILKPGIIKPSEAEIKNNPRARSAKMRQAVKI